MSDNDIHEGTKATPAIEQQFASEREKKDITLERVHTDTRLTTVKLRAIEQGDFDSLGPDVYAIGYIRKYANYLNLDADAIVEQYRSLRGIPGTDSLPTEDLSESATQVEGPVNIPLFRVGPSRRAISLLDNKHVWMGGAGLCALVIILIFWVGKTDREDIEQSERSQALAQNGSSSGSTMMPDEIVEPAELMSFDDVDAAGDTSMADRSVSDIISTTTSALPASADPSGGVLVESTLPNGVGVVSEEPYFDGVQTDRTPSGTVSQPNALVTTPDSAGVINTEAGLNVPDSVLEIRFTDECWVEIRDRFEHVVFADLKNTGDNLRLLGKAPFSVMFGNVRGVDSVSIDSQPVDVVARGSRKTLRLTVDAP